MSPKWSALRRELPLEGLKGVPTNLVQDHINITPIGSSHIDLRMATYTAHSGTTRSEPNDAIIGQSGPGNVEIPHTDAHSREGHFTKGGYSLPVIKSSTTTSIIARRVSGMRSINILRIVCASSGAPRLSGWVFSRRLLAEG